MCLAKRKSALNVSVAIFTLKLGESDLPLKSVSHIALIKLRTLGKGEDGWTAWQGLGRSSLRGSPGDRPTLFNASHHSLKSSACSCVSTTLPWPTKKELVRNHFQTNSLIL